MVTSNSIESALASQGREFMETKSVLVCGVARDCAGGLPATIEFIDKLGALFRTYRALVVENDSTDATGALLDVWADRNPAAGVVHFSHVESAVEGPEPDSEEPAWFRADRIRRICFARNVYLAWMSGVCPDYVVVVDMDLDGISLEGLATSFARPDAWKAVASNGFRYTLRRPFTRSVYWDTYAYEPSEGFENGAQSVRAVRGAQLALMRRLRSNEWISALSAFGGLCIYRGDVLQGARYSVLPNADPKIPYLCEHVGLHRAIRERDPSFRVHINPLQTVRYETIPHTLKRSVSERLGRWW
jgi:hypothetical protein